MKSSFLLKTLIIFFIFTFKAQAYYGRHSKEATLSFSHKVEFFRQAKLNLRKIKTNPFLHRAATKIIKNQIEHLMGYFQSEFFYENFGFKGTLGEEYDFEFTQLKKGKKRNQWFLSYDFKGIAAVEKEIFGRKKNLKVSLRLPLNPKTIYKRGVKKGKNLCTDDHYNSESDFFYFWDPNKKGCPLKNDFKNVPKIKASLTTHKNTRWSYPEYDKLYGDNGNGQDLEIYVFFGYIDELKNPFKAKTKDDSFLAYQKVKSALIRRGLELIENESHFRLYPHEEGFFKGANFFSYFRKKVSFRGKTLHLKIKLFLTDTGIDSEDDTFHYYYKKALNEADIIEYEGHSGLGANLSLDQLEIDRIDNKKYQLLFFNACSTYKYFNQEYLNAKGGPENLDIILSGLPTYSDSAANNSLAFLDNFLDASLLTFQTIISRIENSSEGGPYLYSVVGDKDNSWRPNHKVSSKL
jgi:hypothetical protein